MRTCSNRGRIWGRIKSVVGVFLTVLSHFLLQTSITDSATLIQPANSGALLPTPALILIGTCDLGHYRRDIRNSDA